jgi:hypothetical protein
MTNADCQDTCGVPAHGVYCCDDQINACYLHHRHTCPANGTGSSASSSGYGG